jgi:protease-4
MKRLIVVLLAVVGGLTLALLVLGLTLAVFARFGKPSVPGKTILEANFESRAIEDPPSDPFAQLQMRGSMPIRDVVDALHRAANDGRVRGLVARVGASPMSLAQAQEIRDAVRFFRSKGKFAVAWSETFGEFGPGNTSYYLATAFDQVWLQPSGDIGLTGVIMETPFLRSAFDKLGIVPRMDHRYEYKNALNTYTETHYTPPHREAMDAIARSWFSQMLKGVAAGRKMSVEQAQALVNRGPFLGKEALDARLVDGLGYRDEVYAKVKARGGSDAKLLYLNKYLDRAGRPNQKGKIIALIHGVGGVQRGSGDYDPLMGQSMGSDPVTAAFRQAIDDRNVRAILFRVDSPGGSYVASDAIWRETVRARKAGKPVVVSMGTLAGSGGYFVAMAADKIVAQPGTITGSIGVLGGKLITQKLWGKAGINWDEVHVGNRAAMFSGTKDFTPEEWARVQNWLDRVYTDFTSKVADGRKLPKERVLEIAKGRIWTGEDAKGLGLVDELGGFPAALRLAKQAAKIPDTEEVHLKPYPPKKTAAQTLLAMLQGEERDSSDHAYAALTRVLQTIGPLYRQLRAAGAFGEPEVLEMPVTFGH